MYVWHIFIVGWFENLKLIELVHCLDHRQVAVEDKVDACYQYFRKLLEVENE